jgi:AcrR family transcriptional regulator
MMSREALRERQRQVREDAILDAADELLSEQGYAEMSMDELAARAGVSKATLYQHFPSKEDLVVAGLVRAMRRGAAAIDAADPSLPAIKRLELMIRRGLERKATCMFPMSEMMPGSLRHHPRLEDERCRMADKLTRMVEAAKAEGSIAPELSTPVIVFALRQLFQAPYGDLLSTGQCTPAELSGTLVTMLFDGLRSKPE